MSEYNKEHLCLGMVSTVLLEYDNKMGLKEIQICRNVSLFSQHLLNILYPVFRIKRLLSCPLFLYA